MSLHAPSPALACPVRGCAQPLVLGDDGLRCPAGHHIDRARHGYWNLLQPQDRRSRTAGDAKEAVVARAQLVEAGAGLAVLQRMAGLVRETLAATTMTSEAARIAPTTVVDLGTGSGELVGLLLHAPPALDVIGLDLSTAAMTVGARRWPTATWVVANADRTLPLRDASVAVITSVHARRNPRECARVLAPDGRLLVAIPAPDDVQELRAAVLGTPTARDRAQGVVDEHAAQFTCLAREELRAAVPLEPPLLRALLAGTYRGRRASAQHAVDALAPMTVTFASTLLTFVPRR